MYTLLVWVFVCLSVRLYSINVETAEPIGPKFVVAPRVDNRFFKNLAFAFKIKSIF